MHVTCVKPSVHYLSTVPLDASFQKYLLKLDFTKAI